MFLHLPTMDANLISFAASPTFTCFSVLVFRKDWTLAPRSSPTTVFTFIAYSSLHYTHFIKITLFFFTSIYIFLQDSHSVETPCTPAPRISPQHFLLYSSLMVPHSPEPLVIRCHYGGARITTLTPALHQAIICSTNVTHKEKQ